MAEEKIRVEDISETKKQQLKEKLEKFIKIFDREAETQISNKLKEATLQDLTNKQFIHDLKQLTNNQKTISYIESLEERTEDILGVKYGEKDFDMDKYKDLNKTKQAIKMADWCNRQMYIKPVDIDPDQDQTSLYKYDNDTGIWKYYSRNKIGRLCKELAGEEYSRHIENEFTRNLVNHSDNKKIEEMGLPEEEILLEDGTVLNIHTKDTREVTPGDEALYKVATTYDQDADAPEFKQFIKQLLDNKQNQIDTLQEYLGWMLKYPNKDHKKAAIILGVTNSGKSQVADIIAEMFNDRAVQSLSMSQISMERRFHINKLNGAVVNIDRDMSSQHLSSSDTVKQVISQEPLNVEPKGEDSFVIEPTAKHLICSNVAPKPENSNDGAFYERFLTFKAPNSVPKEDRVPNKGKKLFEKEGSGILNWMLEGLERLEENGEFTLEPSAYATKQMWNEYGNSVQRFIWECIEPGTDDDRIPKKELYEEYELWLEDKLMDRKDYHSFCDNIEDLSYVIEKLMSVNGQKKRCFSGLIVKTDSGNLNTQ